MTSEEFRKNAHEAVDWVADYLESIEKFPVKSPVNPGDIIKQLPKKPPQKPERFQTMMADVDQIIMPGITHWQHPHFHAYFPANSSFPSIIGEILTAGIGAQCMVWETSPAAAELEERMMQWLKEMMFLPKHWDGVIQDTASTATLCAILSAREHVANINRKGFEQNQLRVYCSSEAHSSVAKGVKIAGIGTENIVMIPVDDSLAMLPKYLDDAISDDLKNGLIPCCVISALGTTGTLAFDPTQAIGEICQKHKVWFHVDAAYAGNAMILPEADWLREGLELADSFVFNPHKWMMVNFDCSVYFVKDKQALLNTFEILPEYLKTKTHGEVNDYRDWGVQLGRRFRALKLWFVIRSFGVDGIRKVIGQHIEFGTWFAQQVEAHPQIQLVTPPKLNVVVLRYFDESKTQKELNETNENILQQINQSGKAFLSHTKVSGVYAIRVVLAQTHLEMHHVEALWDTLKNTIKDIS
ncbi:MAG: aspartate aminotransferase family protein [Cyclobacteriaceae bacterium]